MGQHIRIQLEGLNLMEFEKIEVFGAQGVDESRGTVVAVRCGKRVTAAIVKADNSADDLKVAFERSLAANPANEGILRNFKVYRDMSSNKKTKGGKEVLSGNVLDQIGCILCAGGMLCEICQMKNDFRDIIGKRAKGSSPCLEAIVRILLDVENVE